MQVGWHQLCCASALQATCKAAQALRRGRAPGPHAPVTALHLRQDVSSCDNKVACRPAGAAARLQLWSIAAGLQASAMPRALPASGLPGAGVPHSSVKVLHSFYLNRQAISQSSSRPLVATRYATLWWT